jgi:hypothetical protein
MKLLHKLNDFNTRLAAALLPSFPAGATTAEDIDGTLLIRVTTPTVTDPNHIGTHVAIALESGVREKFEGADAALRDLMIQTMIDSLITQIQCTYDPKNVGPYAQDFIGKLATLKGLTI